MLILQSIVKMLNHQMVERLESPISALVVQMFSKITIMPKTTLYTIMIMA